MAMNIGDLFQFVLVITLVAMVLGVGILTLDKFATTTGVTTTAATSLNNSRDALATISTDWLTLIVTIAVLAIIIGLVIGAFAFKQR